MSREELEAEALRLFTGIGLAEQTAQQAIVKPKFRQALVDLIKEAGVAGGCPKSQGALLYTTASKYPANALAHRTELLAYITSDRIRSNAQLDGALEYLGKVGSEPIDVAKFEEAAGVGVEVTPDQIKAAVAACVQENEAKLKEERYHCNLNILLGKMRAGGGLIKWADVNALKAELEAQVAALLGPKTEADMAKPDKKKKAKPAAENGAAPAAAKAKPAGKAKEEAEAWRTADPYAFLPKPAENNMVHTTVHFSDGRKMNIANTPDLLAAHLKETGGKVVTRFPPEPNGYLHIGHAKAMFVDFGMAAQNDGVCYLRFDDTNPEAEKQEYIDHIQEIVGWLGWKPWKITYSSDYFDQLYAFAVQLIKSGNAYVCHQTADEIKEYRERREPSPWRDRPIEDSLKLFEDMRRGLVDEGKATLRMKMDHKNENYNMFDLIAYRIKFVEHPHAGDKYCVYPSYDFTHCLVDALENITHSMCTLEFETRRASYYWLLEVLGTYKPLVWEYSRLNITHNVMSKRKLNRLVTDKYVHGWDDPRLLTLAGLRRRGVTPQAINNFCREIGVTRSEGEVHLHKLDHHIRADLDATSRRALGVLRPLRVVITNLPDSHYEEVEAKYFPGRSEDGYKVPFTKVVYIEETDFREADSKDYYGLAPGKAVMLRYAYPITCTGFTKDPATGWVTEVQKPLGYASHSPPGHGLRPGKSCTCRSYCAVWPPTPRQPPPPSHPHTHAHTTTHLYSRVQATYEADLTAKKPPKGVLNWVGQPAPGKEPPTFEARLYDVLFKSQNPASAEDWLADLNPDSLVVVKGAYATPELAKAQPGDRFQLERLGYFCADPDTAAGSLVLNRTCALKESFPKQTSGKVQQKK